MSVTLRARVRRLEESRGTASVGLFGDGVTDAQWDAAVAALKVRYGEDVDVMGIRWVYDIPSPGLCCDGDPFPGFAETLNHLS